MVYLFSKWVGFLALVLGLISTMHAASMAYPPTESGVFELKTLPAGVLVRSELEGDYFENSGALFRPLFRYIQRKDIAMTVPVEARMGALSGMTFWVGEGEQIKAYVDLGASGNSTAEGVVVLRREAQLVASHGGRGSYTRKNFEQSRDRLLAWVQGQTELRLSGEVYAVYWSSPFNLPFLKRYEVQVPVIQTGVR